jgi:hypothetical protein
VLGTPTPATRDGALRLLPEAPPKPAVLDPAPNVVTVVGQPSTDSTGAASGDGGHRAGRNHQHQPKHHHPNNER